MGVLAHFRPPHALNNERSKSLSPLVSSTPRVHLPGLVRSSPRGLPLPTRSLAGKVSFGDSENESSEAVRLPSLATLKRAAQNAGEELISGPAASRSTSSMVAGASQIVDANIKPKAAATAQAEPVRVPSLPDAELMPKDVLTEFEHKLEADVATVGVTIVAILGVIIFWRGVWALLDHFIGDSVFGDLCCVIVGLSIVLYIRLSGYRIASFWPPS